ncbi:MAG: hypothetical protein KY460_06835 [Actinobacteria bacterium]|nr:hypothetical protein [Actinomycetota bacterium]
MTTSGTTRLLGALVVVVRVALVLALIAVITPMVVGEPGVLDQVINRGRPVDTWTEASVVFTRDGATAAQRRQLRSRLQAHLAHHATLSVRFMRATVSGDPGFVDAANAVLVRNTNDLRETLQPAFGKKHAEAFASGWEQHTRHLFSYAAGVRDGDEAAIDDAKAQLAEYVDQQSALLADATNGKLSASLAATKLQMQIDLLLFQIDAYGTHNYAQAYELERAAFANMYPLGAAIAAAAAGEDPRTISTSPREETASSLALLMDEHVELSIDVVRAGASGASEFGAAASALDDNTADLTSALDTLLGSRRAKRFNRRWVRHVDLLMRYTVAVAEDDVAARTALQRKLDKTMSGFGPALAKATGGKVKAKAIANDMTTHQYQMLDQISAYINANYEQAHDTAYDAYVHMNDLAQRLGNALGKAVRDGLPRGGAATGGGGTATQSA